MAEKKKPKSEVQSPPKVPPKKSEAEMPKKKKDKDKAPRGSVSFAISGKGPQKSDNAAPTRPEWFQHEGGYDRDLVLVCFVVSVVCVTLPPPRLWRSIVA